MLDLSDLLDPAGTNTIDSSNITDYLNANFDSGTGLTTIGVYTGGNAADAGATPDQVIIVNGDLATDLSTLINNGTIIVDND